MCDETRAKGKNATISNLAKCLEQHFKKPVINDTELTKTYDFEIVFSSKAAQGPSIDLARKELESILGIKIVEDSRMVELLVVAKQK